MADNRQQVETLRQALTERTAQRDDAQADLKALKTSIWKMLKTDGIGAEELAVGLALVASITSSWPRSYVPDEAKLAQLARVEPGIVKVALDTFMAGGVLVAGEN